MSESKQFDDTLRESVDLNLALTEKSEVASTYTGLDELRVLKKNCWRIVDVYKKCFEDRDLPWDECFLNCISSTISYPSHEVDFWSGMNPYEDINLYWNFDLSEEAHFMIHALNSEKRAEIFCAILNLLLGHFTIHESYDFFCIVSFGATSILNLIPLIVIQRNSRLNIRIKLLYALLDKSNEWDVISRFLQECIASERIFSSNHLGNSNISEYIKWDGNKYIPISRDLCVNFDTMPMNENPESEEANYQHGKPEFEGVNYQHENYEPEVVNYQHENYEFPELKQNALHQDMEYVREGNNEQLEGFFMQGNDINIINYDLTQEKREIIEEIKGIIGEIIEEIKETIEEKPIDIPYSDGFHILETNCKEFLIQYNFSEIRKEENTHWTDVLLDWEYLKELKQYELMKKSFVNFNPYKDIPNIYWEISIDSNVLKILQDAYPKHREIYFYYILNIGQGLCIQDNNHFYRINENSKDYFIVSWDLKQYLLPILVGLLYIKSAGHEIMTSACKIIAIAERIENLENSVNDYLKFYNCEYESLSKMKDKSIEKTVIVQEDKLIMPIPILNNSQQYSEFVNLYALWELDDNLLEKAKIQIKTTEWDEWNNFDHIQLKMPCNPKARIYSYILDRKLCKDFVLRFYADKYLSHANFYENKSQRRDISKDPYQFILNLKFENSPSNYVYKSVIGKQVSDPYLSLLCFAQYLFSQNAIENGVPFLISQFIAEKIPDQNAYNEYYDRTAPNKINYKQTQIQIANYICEELLKNFETFPEPLTYLNRILSLLGLLAVDSYAYANFSVFENIFFSLENEFNNIIIKWKSMENYDQVINALIGILINFKSHNLLRFFFSLLKEIKEYRLLFKIFHGYLSNINALKMSLASEELCILIEKVNLFNIQHQKTLWPLIIICYPNLDFILKIINDCKEKNIIIEDDMNKKAFDKAFSMENDYDPVELFKFLNKLECCSHSIRTLLYGQQLCGFILKCLKNPKYIKGENVSISSKILNEYSNMLKEKEKEKEGRWGKEKEINCKDIVLLYIDNIGFTKAMPLILLYEQDFEQFHRNWLLKMKDRANYQGTIKRIDEELSMWDDDFISKTFGNNLINYGNDLKDRFSKNSINYLFETYSYCLNPMIIFIDNCKANSLKSYFKNSFLERLFAGGYSQYLNSENVSKELEKLSSQHKDCKLLEELMVSILNTNDLTPEIIKENILINPSIEYIWYKFLENSRRSHTKFSIAMHKYIAELCQSIVSKTIQRENIKLITKQSSEAKKSFIEYLNITMKVRNLPYRNEFLSKLQEAEETFNVLQSDLDNLPSLFCNFILDSENLQNLKQLFDNYQSNFMNNRLDTEDFPEEIYKYRDLCREIHPVLNSKIYQYYFTSKKESFSLMSGSIIQAIDLDEEVQLKSQSVIIHANIDKDLIEKNGSNFKLTDNNFIDYALFAFREMKHNLEELLQNLPEQILIRLNEISKCLKEGNLNTEMKIIGMIVDSEHSNLILLEDTFYAMIKEELLYRFCGNIINTRTYIHLYDEKICSFSWDYINNIKKKEFLTIEEYMLAYYKITKILNSELDIQNWEIFHTLFKAFQESKEVLEFSNKLSQEELDHLQEGITENSENPVVTTEQLLNFLNIWSFFSEFREEKHNFVNYIKSLQAKLKDQRYINIREDLCVSKYHIKALNELYSNLNFQEEAKKKKILQIYESSKIKLTLFKTKFNVHLFIQKNDQEMTPELLIDLLELRDRALLNAHIKDSATNTQDDAKDLEIFKSFIELVDTIDLILKELRSLRETFYREQLNLGDFFYCNQGEFEQLRGYQKYIHETYSAWEEKIKELSDQHYLLNFLYGKQFYLIEKFVFQQTAENLLKVLPILKYTRRLFSSDRVHKIEFSLDLSTRINIISSFIEGFNQIQENYQYTESPKMNQIKQHPRQILICETKKFYKGILSIYYNTGRYIPKIDEVFFCNFHTNWKELSLFLNRCFLDPLSNLYTLVKPELLSLENQINFKTRFHELCEEYSRKEFFFAVVTSNIKSHLINYFRYQTDIENQNILSYQLLKDNEIKEIIKKVDKITLVVTSANVGLGKTTFIRKQIGSSNRKYIEINISGNSSSMNLAKILKKIQPAEPIALHLQINSLEETTSVHELIFSLSIFKQFYSSKGLFYLPEGSLLFIEIANTLNNSLYQSLSYLKILENHFIKNFDLCDIIVDNRIQYVCNYLKSYSDKSINRKDLSYSLQNYKQLSVSSIQKLLTEYFLKTCQASPSYHQLDIFLNLLTNLFRNFENSSYSAEIIHINKEDMKAFRDDSFITLYDELRSSIIGSLLETTKEFTSKCLDSVKSRQISSMNKMHAKKNEEEDKEEEITYKCNIAWENSNHFTMLFLAEGDSLCIYRDPEMVPRSIIELLSAQKILEENVKKATAQGFKKFLNDSLSNKNSHIENYSSLSSSELIQKLISFYARFSLRHYHKKPKFTIDDYRVQRLNELNSSGYILTPDNFLKMNLIYIRCISNIPLLIMGETGCGKTSLIRFFVKEILQERLDIICIHSGITSEYIYSKMNEINELACASVNKRFWIFFDEFNTSDCIGMLCDILCEKKVRDIELSPNIIFVGACNPYRIKSSKQTYIEDVGIKKSNKYHSNTSRLVHIVKPLPEKAIEYIWDFGILKRSEIKEYIKSMLDSVGYIYSDMFNCLICEAHDYFQRIEDVSSVSLRDVSRFIDLLLWFQKSLSLRQANPPENVSDKYNKYNALIQDHLQNIDLLAGILALFHCYFLRISSRDQRDAFLNQISQKLMAFYSTFNITKEAISNIIKFEQFDYLCRMRISEGTALNLALRENIFAIIPCVLNKIPILICGKPGCSKSLAIQLITSNLRGDKSKDKYFKTLPELQIVSFQGSDSCTSEGIGQVFERANRLLSNKYLLPVVVFDEIGLAEISKHNPLKVLHGLLEKENRQVAFIGISNWRLDASKMNRALYLARPDPTKKDLINTASSIFKSIIIDPDTINNYLPMIKSIAECYFELKEYYKSTEFVDFYGLRDFYYLVKQISHKLKDKDFSVEEIISNVKLSIERNFGGKIKAVKFLWNTFCEKYFNFKNPNFTETPIRELILENLSEKESRYLMIITRKDVAVYLIDNFLKDKLQDPRIFLGSKFENDLNREDAGFRTLSDIVRYMERGISIILNDMECAYSSLYDLFNQNFSKSGADRKYCRIALGAQFNPRCFVHDQFKAIIFMDEDEESLQAADAPFLNRFEKHYISLEQILDKQQVDLVNDLKDWIEKSIDMRDNKKNLLEPISIYPCYSHEALYLLVLYNQDNTASEEELIYKCKVKLIQSATVDLLIINQYNKHDDNEKIFIENKWIELHRKNLLGHLTDLIQDDEEKNRLNKLIAVTYDEKNIDTDLKRVFGNRVILQKVSNFKSEDDANKDFKGFYTSTEGVIYMLDMEYNKEGQHLRLIISLLEKIEIESSKMHNINKIVCVLIRMNRNDENRKPLGIFRQWNLQFFEKLSDNNLELIGDVLNYDITQIINSNTIVEYEKMIPELAERSINALRYQSYLYNMKEINEFILQIEQFLTENDEIRELIKEKIYKVMNNTEWNVKKKWTEEIFMNKGIIIDAKSAKDGLRIYVQKYLINEYTKLVFLIEKKSAFYSFLIRTEEHPLKDLWKSIFWNLSTSEIGVQLSLQSNLIIYYKELSIPFVIDEYKKIKDIYKEIFSLKNITDANKLELFKDRYFEKSLWKDYLKIFDNDKELNQQVLKDFIRIILTDSICDYNYLDAIWNIYLFILDSDDFIENILSFIKYENKIPLLHKIFEIYSKCTKDNEFAWIFEAISGAYEVKIDQKSKEEKENKLILKENPDEKIVLNISELEEEKEKLEDNSEEEGFSSSEEESSNPELAGDENWNKLKMIFTTIFTKLIDGISPSSQIMKICLGQDKYLQTLQSIDAYIDLMDSFDLEIKNKPKFDFWIQICKIPLISPLLIKLSRMLKDKPAKYLKSLEFSCMLLREINEIPIHFLNDLQIKKLKMYYYSLIIIKNPEKLNEFVLDVNSSDVWKYCGYVVNRILEEAEIKDCIEHSEGTENRIDIINGETNKFLGAIEKILRDKGVNNNFGILLSDRIYQLCLEMNDYQDCLCDLFQFYSERIENPRDELNNIASIIAMARIRRLLEYYSEILIKEERERSPEEEDQFREMSVELENPRNKAYTLFIYKKLNRYKN